MSGRDPGISKPQFGIKYEENPISAVMANLRSRCGHPENSHWITTKAWNAHKITLTINIVKA
jgi:hypothetical protein